MAEQNSRMCSGGPTLIFMPACKYIHLSIGRIP